MADSPMELLLRSWVRSLRARALSKDTVSGYTQTVENFIRWRTREGLPLDPAATTRDEVNDWTTWLLETRSPGTAEARFTGLKAFFTWLAKEGEIPVSPMSTLTAPKAPEPPVEVVSAADIEKLFKSMAGNGFFERRDLALIAVYVDTGARRSELAGLHKDEDVDLDLRRIRVVGKGGKARSIRIGHLTTTFLDRYLRVRSRHRFAYLPDLWLSQRGALAPISIHHMFKRRALAAGLGDLHLHQLRHTAATAWLDAGGSTLDLRELMGWSSDQMVRRYTKHNAGQRALEAHDNFGLVDRLGSGKQAGRRRPRR